MFFMRGIIKESLNSDAYLYMLGKKIWHLSILATYKTFHVLFPIKKNKVVIASYKGKGYGDNAKYIVNEILQKDVACEIVWMVSDIHGEKNSFPSDVRLAEYNSVASIYELSTAGVWIDNCRKPPYVLKRNGQIYIQTWHGGVALKKIEGDAADKLPEEYIKNARIDTKNIDIMVSNSKFISDVYRRAFWYSGEVIETGYPRSDILFEDRLKYKKRLRKRYGLDDGVKVLLYAPTFRDSLDVSSYKVDCNRIVRAAESRFGGDWVFAVRLHPNVSSLPVENILPNSLNVSNHPDMQELLVGVDVLVTDYSSCMFDSAIAKIPTFIYASDIEDYATERGFYFTFDELPFSVSTSGSELAMSIMEYDEQQYLENLERFYSKVGLCDDGKASERVVDVIEKLIK